MKLWCALRCVFDIVIVLDQTLCLQPMAGHSVRHYLVRQKPQLKRNYKLDDLGAGLEITKWAALCHGAEPRTRPPTALGWFNLTMPLRSLDHVVALEPA